MATIRLASRKDEPSLQRHRRNEVGSQSRLDYTHPLVRLPSTSESWHETEVAVDLVRRSCLALTAVSSRNTSQSSFRFPDPTDANQSDHARLPFDPLQGVALAPPCPSSFERGASPGVPGPLQRQLTGRLHLPGFQPRVTLPRPRFLPAFAAILPACQFRACFIPEALLRFTLQGFPLARRLGCFRIRDTLLPLPRWPPRLPLASPERAGGVWSGFRVLLSVRVRSLSRSPLRARDGRSPPEFLPP